MGSKASRTCAHAPCNVSPKSSAHSITLIIRAWLTLGPHEARITPSGLRRRPAIRTLTTSVTTALFVPRMMYAAATAGISAFRTRAITLTSVTMHFFLVAACAAFLASSADAKLDFKERVSAGPLPTVRAVEDDLRAGGRLFRAYGFNYVGIEETHWYFTGRRPLRKMVRELRDMARMGNTARVFLELPDYLADPDGVRGRLRRLLRAAERVGIYLDLTGNLVWRQNAPAWYDAMDDRERWEVQARFWSDVARVGSRSSAVLCYELTNEPVIGRFDSWYLGRLFGYDFGQTIAQDTEGQDTWQIAREWVSQLKYAIRRYDRRHMVGVGLLSTWPEWAFGASNMAQVLDVLIVHDYPESASPHALLPFTETGKPLILGETFSWHVDPPTFKHYLRNALPHLDGALTFFDGRMPGKRQSPPRFMLRREGWGKWIAPYYGNLRAFLSAI